MAILTKNEKYIVDMYVRYFGKAPSVAEIAKYNDFKTQKEILTEIRGDADDSKAGLTTEEFVNNAFQNLFGRDATTKEMNKYAKVVDAGEDLPINAIVKSAKKSDKGVYEAKQAIAIMLAEKDNATIYNNLDKITKDTYAKVYDLKTKKLLVDSVAQLETKIDAMPDNVSGKTFNLTASIDTLPGTEKGDVFNGIVDSVTTTNSTLTALDSIDGGAGKDTLNVLATAVLTIPTGLEVKNVETVNLKAGTTITADTASWTGLNTANVTKATDVELNTAATTDVNVSAATGTIEVSGGKNVVVNDSTANKAITIGQASNITGVTTTNAAGTITVTDTKQGTGAITIDGGTDVTVTATADKVAAGTITVGANKAATGDVKIVSNTTSDGTAATAGNVTVTGGKTVEITANMTNTAVKGAAGANITAGTYTVTAGNTTTDVTITQNATATDFENDAAAGTAEVSTVTFGSLKAGEKATIGAGTLTGTDLTFTASKDLSAAQVAAAFANLTAADTQSNTGITANGYFTGILDTGWTSGAVSGSSVTFTATAVGNKAAANEITVSAKKADGITDTDNKADFKIASKTDGTAAGASTAVTVAEKFGNVVVDDNATKSITTITLDGFDKADLGGTTAAKSLDKLATLNLTNGQSTGTTTLNSTVATLTVNVDDMAGTVDLGSNLKTLTLNANGEDSKFALSAVGVETLTINATADLDISAAGTDIDASKSITVKGAGQVDLGDISGATALNTFNASGNTGGVTATVLSNAASLNADGYVFSAGNDDVTLSASIVSTKVTLGAGDDIVTLDAGTTALAAVIDGGTGSDTLAMEVVDAHDVSALTDGAFETKITGFEKLSLTATAASTAASIDLSKFDDIDYVISAGTAGTGGTLLLDKMANNGTLELTGALLSAVTVTMKDATGNTDTFNIVTKVDASDVNTSTGAVVVAGVETINVTATDISPVNTDKTSVNFGKATISQAKLILTADAAKTVNVTGNSDIDLSTGTATAHANLKTVDASAMTGALTYTISSTVADFALTSNTGADNITVALSNNAQVKTGAGDDTITVQAGAVSANIWGGAGNDVFDVTGTISSATQYVTIEDATAGDQIILDTTHFLSGSVSITDFDQMTLTDKFNAVLGDTGLNVDRGADDSFAISFQHAGNTYIVVSDGTAGSTFGVAGTDQVIKLTGLKDLSAGASFNVDGTLEIA